MLLLHILLPNNVIPLLNNSINKNKHIFIVGLILNLSVYRNMV